MKCRFNDEELDLACPSCGGKNVEQEQGGANCICNDCATYLLWIGRNLEIRDNDQPTTEITFDEN